jgi:hypothetical protein
MANEQKPWRNTKDWKYPYESVTDPNYLEDRAEFFKGHNGWWWKLDDSKKKKRYLSSDIRKAW